MKNVSKDTIIRTIVTFVALVNSVLTMIGKNPLPFSDDEMYLFFSTLDIVKDEAKEKGYTK